MSSTVDQLRQDIDTGRTQDKVRHFDPAAAPLGTDEEAAGTPIPSKVVDLARRQEISGPPRSNEDGGVIPYIVMVVSVITILTTAAVVLLPR